MGAFVEIQEGDGSAVGIGGGRQTGSNKCSITVPPLSFLDLDPLNLPSAAGALPSPGGPPDSSTYEQEEARRTARTPVPSPAFHCQGRFSESPQNRNRTPNCPTSGAALHFRSS